MRCGNLWVADHGAHLIHGVHDAKAEGFLPGGASLRNTWTSHGPDPDTYTVASSVDLVPHKVDDTLAFMFETRLPVITSEQAMALPTLQDDYDEVWVGIERHYDGPRSLVAGLESAGVERLLVVGGAGSLVDADGTRRVDADDFPAAWKPGSLAQVDSLSFYRAYDGPVAWTYLSPADHIGPGPRGTSVELGVAEPR